MLGKTADPIRGRGVDPKKEQGDGMTGTRWRRHRRRRAARRGMLAAALLMARSASAAGIIDLGLADEFTLSQPVVQVAVSSETKTFDLWFFNECMLDTGASGILMGATASDFLRGDGFQEVATYVDFGVAGPQSTGVSAP